MSATPDAGRSWDDVVAVTERPALGDGRRRARCPFPHFGKTARHALGPAAFRYHDSTGAHPDVVACRGHAPRWATDVLPPIEPRANRHSAQGVVGLTGTRRLPRR